MAYSWEELKSMIGGDAKSIIEQERGTSSSGKMMCVVTDHKKGDVPMVWYADGFKFYCHDCGGFYDCIDHAQWLSNDDNSAAYKTLHELAKTPYEGSEAPKKPEKQHIKPVVIEKPVEIEFPAVDPASRIRTVESIRCMEARGISSDTMAKYGVTGTTQGVCFNYVIGGQLVKVKVRRVGNIENGKHKYDLTPKGGSNVLYGQHLYRDQRALLVCEGEIDALSAHEALSRQKMESMILCSSIPSGSKSFNWIENSKAFIDKFDSVIVVGDKDATGKEFIQKTLAKMVEIKRVFTCDSSRHKVNDINQLLVEYGAKEVVDCILDTKEYKPSYTVDFDNLKKDDGKATFCDSGFFHLDKKLYGLQHGMVTVFTGRSGDGKTTILRQIIDYNNRMGQRVGAMMGEESAKKFRERFMMQSSQMNSEYFEPFCDKWENSRHRLNDPGIQLFNGSYGSKIGLIDNAILIDDDAVDKVFKWINYESNILGTKLFIIDNLMKFESGADAKDVYALQARW